jgi:PAS domain S-box-containing protein
LGRLNPNGPNIQHCLSGGLWDAGVSITLGGKQIASWLIGQVRDESMDLSNLRRYAEEIGVDEETFMKAFEELPIMSLEQFTQVSNTLFTLANHLFLTSYMNLQQARMIEEMERTQLTLKANEEKFRMLFDNSMIGKSMTEIDGTLHVNKAFCDMLGYTEEELKALKWSDISHPDEVEISRENVDKLLRGEVESASFEKRYLHKSGREVWTLISTYLQRDLDGKPLFFITSVIDNTERKRVEEELLQANRNAEKLVQVRTAQLNQTIEKLEEQSRVFVGRELRMIELKEQIDQLQKQLAEKNQKGT